MQNINGQELCFGQLDQSTEQTICNINTNTIMRQTNSLCTEAFRPFRENSNSKKPRHCVAHANINLTSSLGLLKPSQFLYPYPRYAAHCSKRGIRNLLDIVCQCLVSWPRTPFKTFYTTGTLRHRLLDQTVRLGSWTELFDHSLGLFSKFSLEV